MIDPSAGRESGEISSSTLTVGGVRLTTRITPARLASCGGDWCETYVLPDGNVALSIGDVCGHGPERFATMVAVRQSVRDAAVRGLDPTQILAEANRFMCRFEPDLHATALFALFDTGTAAFTFANAGHPPPLMVGPGGSRFVTDAATDLPLGVEAVLIPTLRFERVPAHSLLVLYSDGVTEHERQPLRGEAQLRNAAIFAHTYVAAPSAAVIEDLMFLAGSNHDDVSILTLATPRASRNSNTDAAGQSRRDRLRGQIADARTPRHHSPRAALPIGDHER